MNFLTANAHWLLRIALASVFIFHGVLKFLNLEGFAQMLPISYLEVVLVATAETAGGLLVLLGGFRGDALSDVATRVGAALNLPVMIGAIAMVHAKNGFNVMNGGMEFQLLMLVTGLYFAAKGNDV